VSFLKKLDTMFNEHGHLLVFLVIMFSIFYTVIFIYTFIVKMPIEAQSNRYMQKYEQCLKDQIEMV